MAATQMAAAPSVRRSSGRLLARIRGNWQLYLILAVPIAACGSNGMNTLVAVNAKDLGDTTPQVRFATLVRIEDEESVDTGRRLGVDKVISWRWS